MTSDFRLEVETENTGVSRMRNASGHNYRNSLFIVDLAMGRYYVPQNVFLVNHKTNPGQTSAVATRTISQVWSQVKLD